MALHREGCRTSNRTISPDLIFRSLSIFQEGEVGVAGFAVVVGVAVDADEVAVALQGGKTSLVDF